MNLDRFMEQGDLDAKNFGTMDEKWYVPWCNPRSMYEY